jgi:hypothetical protein
LQKIKLALKTGEMNALYNDPEMIHNRKVMNEFSIVDGIILIKRKKNDYSKVRAETDYKFFTTDTRVLLDVKSILDLVYVLVD